MGNNNSLQYIDKQSNHPPSIIKQILAMISKRLIYNMSDKEHLDKAAPIYSKALKIVVLMKYLSFYQQSL